MPGDAPYADHNPIVVLSLIFFGVIAAGWSVLYGVRLLVRACVTRAASAGVGAATCLAWAATIGMYIWGVLHLLFLDDYAQAQACREVIGPRRLTGYAPSFLPLRFGCQTSDGRSIEAVIPQYVNPSVVALGICAIALAGILIVLHKEESQ